MPFYKIDETIPKQDIPPCNNNPYENEWIITYKLNTVGRLAGIKIAKPKMFLKLNGNSNWKNDGCVI